MDKYRVRQRGCSLTHSARTPPAVTQELRFGLTKLKLRKNNFLTFFSNFLSHFFFFLQKFYFQVVKFKFCWGLNLLYIAFARGGAHLPIAHALRLLSRRN